MGYNSFTFTSTNNTSITFHVQPHNSYRNYAFTCIDVMRFISKFFLKIDVLESTGLNAKDLKNLDLRPHVRAGLSGRGYLKQFIYTKKGGGLGHRIKGIPFYYSRKIIRDLKV